MDTTYRIVLNGVRLGADANTVRANLAKLFRATPEQVEGLLASPGRIIKRGLTAAVADQYRTALESAGAACLVEVEVIEQPTPQVPPAASHEIDVPRKLAPATATSQALDGPATSGKAEPLKPAIEVAGQKARTQATTRAGRAKFIALSAIVLVLGTAISIFIGDALRPKSDPMVASQTSSAKQPNAPFPVGDTRGSAKVSSPAEKLGATDGASLPPNQNVPPDEYAKLLDAATRYITEWNSDPNTRLCDEIVSPGLTDVQRGKVVFITMGGGKVDPPIPAIVARITGTCVQAAIRQREPMTKWWMMMAHDKAFNQYRCIKLGGDDLLRTFANKGCEFVPNPGENGLIHLKKASSEQASPAITTSDSQSLSLPTFAKGESYTNVRLKMLGAGWKPYHSKDADTCSEGDMRCKDRPEMEACSGTGMASCRFLWKSGDKTIAILTTGEENAVVAGVQEQSTAGTLSGANTPQNTPPVNTRKGDASEARVLTCFLKAGKVETMNTIIYFRDGAFIEIDYLVSNEKVLPTMQIAGTYSRSGDEYRRTRRGTRSFYPGQPSQWDRLPTVDIVDKITESSSKRAHIKTNSISVNGVRQSYDYNSAVYSRDCRSEDNDPEQLRGFEKARREVPDEYFGPAANASGRRDDPRSRTPPTPAAATQQNSHATGAKNAAAFCARPPGVTIGVIIVFQNNIGKAKSLGSSCEVAASLAEGRFRSARDMWQSGEALQRAGASGAGNFSQACEWAVEGNEALKKECPQLSR